MKQENAWVTDLGPRPGLREPDTPRPTADGYMALSGAMRPQPSAVAPLPSGGLPVKEFPVSAPQSARTAWWWTGCHGGAGVTSLLAVTGSGRDAQRHWPVLPSGAGPARVVLVARTHDSGLRAAQAAARQWASGSLPPQIELLGLVLIADAPGRLPRPLRDLARLVAGGVPRTWEVEWHEQLRFGPQPFPAEEQPADYMNLTSTLTSITAGESHA
jgi:hypothetical protein